MMARDREFGKSRRTTLRSRVAIAAAVLAGGGAVAAGAVVATSSHGNAPAKVQSAGYSQSFNGGWGTLNSTLTNWGSSTQSSYSQLGRLTQANTFSQYSHNNKMLAIQRGIVVLATKKFIILQSANGKLHLWVVSGATHFKNVSTTMSGMTALTASTTAASQAMTAGNMIPSVNTLVGSPTTAAAMLTPATTPQTVTVQVANTPLTVTVTITRSTATVNQTATTTWNGMPSSGQNTWTQNAWLTANTLRRGDLATIVGFRSHWVLHAQLVLFAPLTTSDVGGKASTGMNSTINTNTNTNTGTMGTSYGYHS